MKENSTNLTTKGDLNYDASLATLFDAYLTYQSVCASNYAYQPVSTDLVFNVQNSVGVEGVGYGKPIHTFQEYCNASKKGIVEIKTSQLSKDMNINAHIIMNELTSNKEDSNNLYKDIANLTKFYEAVMATCTTDSGYNPSVKFDDIKYLYCTYGVSFDKNAIFSDRAFTYPNMQSDQSLTGQHEQPTARQIVENLEKQDESLVPYYFDILYQATRSFELSTFVAQEDVLAGVAVGAQEA